MGDCVSNCKGRGDLQKQDKQQSCRKSTSYSSFPPDPKDKENLPCDPIKRYSKLKLMSEAELKKELE